jgi:hypothetical protein
MTDRLVTAYEALRRQVLDAVDGVARGPGLALLLYRGMSTWMETSAWEPSLSTSESRMAPTPAARRGEASRDEVVLVLTSLVRSHVARRV